MLKTEVRDGVCVIAIQSEKTTNPFSMQMTRDLTALCAALEDDDDVRAALIWGGPERSFSVGGDFREVRHLTDDAACSAYLVEIVASYRAVLALTKPVVAAIDRFAIGQGLQVALMADERIGTERSVYRMPELENGVACPLGATILNVCFGRAVMQELVVGCGPWTAERALAASLIGRIVAPDELFEAAFQRAAELARYPDLPFRSTKPIFNRPLDRALADVVDEAARVHGRCMREQFGQGHFARVLDPGS